MNRTAASIAIATVTFRLAAMADHHTVTLCHAAGHDGTTHFVTLTIGAAAVYGPGGHFNENGSPAAGHEQDYLGECVEDEDPTSTTTTATTVPVVTTTTQLGSTTADTDQAPTTTTIPFDKVPSQVAGLTVGAPVPTDDPSMGSGVTVTAVYPQQHADLDGEPTTPVVMTELPFTGISTGLLVGIALGLATAGTCLLKLNPQSGPE